jgi:hypothetical protein
MSDTDEQAAAAEEVSQTGKRCGFVSQRRAVNEGDSPGRGGPVPGQGRTQHGAKRQRQTGDAPSLAAVAQGMPVAKRPERAESNRPEIKDSEGGPQEGRKALEPRPQARVDWTSERKLSLDAARSKGMNDSESAREDAGVLTLA